MSDIKESGSWWCRKHQRLDGECGVWGWHEMEPITVTVCPDCGGPTVRSVTSVKPRHLPSHVIGCPIAALRITIEEPE